MRESHSLRDGLTLFTIVTCYLATVTSAYGHRPNIGLSLTEHYSKCLPC